MEKFVDLHIHTSYSDGNKTPSEIFHMAHDLKLAAIAITDHDRLDAFDEGHKLSIETGIEFVPGVELTSDWDGHEAHILAYYPNKKAPGIITYMAMALGAREQVADQVINRMHRRGDPVSMDDLNEERQNHKPESGGFPLINLLLRKGLVENVKDFFSKILGPGGPGHMKPPYPDVKEAISAARSAGAVPVMAHPFGYRGGITEEKLVWLKEQGIAGLEAWSSYHGEENRIWVENTARKLGLIVTGGSDCHGDENAVVLRPLGSTNAPYRCLEELKEAHNKI